MKSLAVTEESKKIVAQQPTETKPIHITEANVDEVIEKIQNQRQGIVEESKEV